MKRSTTVCAAAVALATFAMLGTPSGAVRAEVPTGTPVFSAPTTFTNRFMPFKPGGMKVMQSKESKTREVVLDLYLAETRSFAWNNTAVTTRVLREIAFGDGLLKEIADNYFAQADDGTVYYFGEVVDNYENGVVVNHNGSWLVSGPTLPTDPQDSAVATVPAVFMPANPEVGDLFKPEDLFPQVDETVEVKKGDVRVRVAADRFDGSIEVEETSRLVPDRVTKWYAPGVGVVKSREKGAIVELISSNFTEP